jgi:hypothetical protein
MTDDVTRTTRAPIPRDLQGPLRGSPIPPAEGASSFSLYRRASWMNAPTGATGPAALITTRSITEYAPAMDVYRVDQTLPIEGPTSSHRVRHVGAPSAKNEYAIP